MTVAKLPGYGFSVWYVPCRKSDISMLQKKYDMKHTPHVTAATNLRVSEAVRIWRSLPKKVIFTAKEPCTRFPCMYENNPLSACGFYGSLWDTSQDESVLLKLAWQPHMSVKYFERDDNTMIASVSASTLSYPLECERFFVNTQSTIPIDWSIL